VRARLLVEVLLGVEQMTARGPGVCGTAGDLAVAEMLCGDPSVARCEVQLRGCIVVEPRRSLEPLLSGVRHV
jgi:hypothetical protein